MDSEHFNAGEPELHRDMSARIFEHIGNCIDECKGSATLTAHPRLIRRLKRMHALMGWPMDDNLITASSDLEPRTGSHGDTYPLHLKDGNKDDVRVIATFRI